MESRRACQQFDAWISEFTLPPVLEGNVVGTFCLSKRLWRKASLPAKPERRGIPSDSDIRWYSLGTGAASSSSSSSLAAAGFESCLKNGTIQHCTRVHANVACKECVFENVHHGGSDWFDPSFRFLSVFHCVLEATQRRVGAVPQAPSCRNGGA